MADPQAEEPGNEPSVAIQHAYEILEGVSHVCVQELLDQYGRDNYAAMNNACVDVMEALLLTFHGVLDGLATAYNLEITLAEHEKLHRDIANSMQPLHARINKHVEAAVRSRDN